MKTRESGRGPSSVGSDPNGTVTLQGRSSIVVSRTDRTESPIVGQRRSGARVVTTIQNIPKRIKRTVRRCREQRSCTIGIGRSLFRHASSGIVGEESSSVSRKELRPQLIGQQLRDPTSFRSPSRCTLLTTAPHRLPQDSLFSNRMRMHQSLPQ